MCPFLANKTKVTNQVYTYILIVASLIIAIAYYCWYSFVGKTPQPLTASEAKVIWLMHKKQTSCTGSQIKHLLHDKTDIIGFKCECGYIYTHTQKKPIVSSTSTKTNITRC